MKHPLAAVPFPARRSLFYFLLVLTLIIFGVFQFLDQPLRTPAAPNGIVSYELAGSLENAQSMLNSWDEKARLAAAFGLGFDYLFMPVYALALSLGLLLAGANKPTWYLAFTSWLGWGAFVAAGFDAIENYALWLLLNGEVSAALPPIAGICATIKFTLLIAGLVTAAAGLFIRKSSG